LKITEIIERIDFYIKKYVARRMDGWMDFKAVLRIAYSNEK
jgi:hypothetical protein